LTTVRGSGDVEGPKGDDDETPHARGPEEIGMEDMGPQVASSVGIGMQGIDVEAAVGRKADCNEQEELEEAQAPTTPKRGASDEMESDSKRIKDDVVIGNGQYVEDEKMAMVDADGKAA